MRQPFSPRHDLIYGGALLGPIASFGAATLVAGGPWIITILALVLITATTKPLVGLETLDMVRLAIVYAFALSLVASTPFAAIAARTIHTRARAGRAEETPAILAAALVLSLAATAVAAAVVFWRLGVGPPGFGLAAGALAAVTAALWCVFIVIAALRRFAIILKAFLAGMGVAIGATILGAELFRTAEAMIWGFALGVAVSAFWMLNAVLDRRGLDHTATLSGLRRYLSDLTANATLFAGVLCAIAAVWIDKWALWAGALGRRLEVGLVEYPLYDSAMFIAHLSILPALSMFFLFKETDLAASLLRLERAIGSRSPLRNLQRQVADLERMIWSRMFHILLAQTAIAAMMIAAAPALIEMAQLQYDQLPILRRGVLAVVFQSLFLLSSYVLLLANRKRLFLLLQAGFLALNAGLTLGFAQIGTESLGLGVLFASGAAGLAAALAAFHATRNLLYFTYIGENDALRGR